MNDTSYTVIRYTKPGSTEVQTLTVPSRLAADIGSDLGLMEFTVLSMTNYDTGEAV
jgi:hypothetical protein